MTNRKHIPGPRKPVPSQLSAADLHTLNLKLGDAARLLLSILPCVDATVTEKGQLVISADDAMRLYKIASTAAKFVRDVDAEGRFDGFEEFQAVIREECRLR